MQITYWSGFTKRDKSTKQPTGGTTANVTLKRPTNILQPAFESATMPESANYIQAFGRYYKVKNVTYSTNDIKVFECTEDYLASWKSDIKASNQYVERSASATAPLNVGDPLNPPTNHLSHAFTNVLNLTTVDGSGINKIIDLDVNGRIVNHYILGITGESGVTYWGLDDTELENVMEAIFASNWVDQFFSTFFNYKDCILSLKRVTYPPGGTSQQIYVGKEPLEINNVPVTGTKIADLRMYRDSGLANISFPADSHLNARLYPYYKPYTFATISLPFVGVIGLDVDVIAGLGKLGVEVFVDPFTADIIYKLRNADGATIGTYSGNCGAGLPISGQSFNAIGMAAGAMQIIGGVAASATGLAIPGAGGIAGGAAQLFEGARVHTQTNGSLSSFIGGYIGTSVKVDVFTNDPASWDLENMKSTQGVIVNKQQSLSGVSGYVQCRNASVSMAGLSAEKETVEAMLNSGIYIE